MNVKSLASVSFDTLMDCFHQSFKGYFVKMPDDNMYFKNRWQAAKVDYDLSFGIFDEDQLVGFIINAVDIRNGKKIAYNTGTGVLPAYRGQKIVKRLYDLAFPIWEEHGIQTYTLEVITKNHGAIKAYEHVGFQIIKTFHCFQKTFETAHTSSIRLTPVDTSVFDWSYSKREDLYSWDNQKEAIHRNTALSYFYAMSNNDIIGYVIADTSKGYIAQIEAFPNLVETYTNILKALTSFQLNWRINNIDNRLSEKIEAFTRFGFENNIDQYEMLLTH
jgi:GNAT superfamily N-acetyltransferase